jgi:hypothetical protein
MAQDDEEGTALLAQLPQARSTSSDPIPRRWRFGITATNNDGDDLDADAPRPIGEVLASPVSEILKREQVSLVQPGLMCLRQDWLGSAGLNILGQPNKATYTNPVPSSPVLFSSTAPTAKWSEWSTSVK